MIISMSGQDLMAYIIFGILLNFVFSLLFGLYLSKNIGVEEMLMSKGDKQQSMFIALAIFIPFLKMLITLYRVAILQIYFLNKGRSYKDFWVYITNESKG